MATFYPSTPFPVQFINPDTGELLSGGVLRAFVAGSTTPTPMYRDGEGTSAGVAVTLNAGGYPTVSSSVIVIWLDDAIDYKFTLEDGEGGGKWSVDNIASITNSFLGSNVFGVCKTLDDAKSPSGPLLTNGRRLTPSLIAAAANTGALIRVSMNNILSRSGWADYEIKTTEDHRLDISSPAWVPDGFGDHYILGGTTFVLIIQCEQVNIQQFGCVGDDSTINTQQLKAAIAYALQFQKKIFIPAGIYRYDEYLELGPYLTIEGAGNQWSWLKPMGAIEGMGYKPVDRIEAKINLRDFRIIGDSAVGLDLLTFARSTAIDIERMSVRNTNKSCIKFDDECHRSHIKDSVIETFGEYGITTTGLNSIITIQDILMNANGKAGIAMLGIGNGEQIIMRAINANGENIVENLLRITNGLSRSVLEDCYVEFLFGSPIRAASADSGDIVSQCEFLRSQLASDDSITIDFDNGSAHEKNVIRGIRNSQLGVSGYIFHPGASTSFDYRNGSLIIGRHVFGYGGLNSIELLEEGSLSINGAQVLGKGTTLSGATPVLTNGNFFEVTNASAVTMTALTGGRENQRITLRATNGNTTVQHGGNFRLRAGVDLVLTVDRILELINIGSNIWLEC